MTTSRARPLSRSRRWGGAPLLAALALAAVAAPASAQQARGTSSQPAERSAAATAATERAFAAEAAEARRRATAARLAELRFQNQLRQFGGELTPAGRDSLVRLSRATDSLRARADRLEQRLLAFRGQGGSRMQPARVAYSRAQPVGWFGVDVQSTMRTTATGGGTVLSASADYPEILAVEPGSPAARAGLMAGDRLVSIRGIDLKRQEVDLSAILTPGATVPVRISRGGSLREVRVAITPRPVSFESGVTVRVVEVPEGRVAMFGEGPMQQVMVLDPEGARVMLRTPAGARGAEAVTLQRTPVAAGTPVPAAAPGAPGAPVYLFSPSPSRMPLAGAELMALNDEFRAVFGVQRGVLVLTTVADLPAARAGLRAGDVIVRADSRPLDSPADLQRMMIAQSDRVLELELVRQRQEQRVRLRW